MTPVTNEGWLLESMAAWTRWYLSSIRKTFYV